MKKKNWSEVQIKTVQNYYEFLLARAKGDLPSPATFIREFVQKHPSYKADSIVPSDVQCDLMRVLRQSNKHGSEISEGLLGKYLKY